ncbi:hypothetical protein GCM10008013_44780 [Paenibacillus segetis]|uniref:Periplasmic copper-binding protein NosD beta helix domain-containing protein n=1 Tax=Paenibacillus segetis TaxID=1325360 RepID=A0ABQ1YSR2_9BACL|nr:hypothetical protein GCM10008013_44780 [Paenibacillus segetis]
MIIPPGIYRIDPKEALPLSNNVHIQGMGQPILRFDAQTSEHYGYEAFMVSGSNITIDSITIDGNKRLIRGVGIHTGSTDVKIVNTYIQNMSQPDDPQNPLYSAVVSGIMIYGHTERITIERSHITNISAVNREPVARGIMVWSEPGQPIARQIQIIGNTISHITPREDADGIFFDKSPSNSGLSDSLIDHNLFQYTAKRGIKIAMPGVTVSNNHIINSYSGNNHYLFPVTDPLPQDMYSAISIYADHVTVSGNTINGIGSYYSAIEADLGPLKHIVITDNSISGDPNAMVPDTSGIRLGKVTDFLITGNRIKYVDTGILFQDENDISSIPESSVANNILSDVGVGIRLPRESESHPKIR